MIHGMFGTETLLRTVVKAADNILSTELADIVRAEIDSFDYEKREAVFRYKTAPDSGELDFGTMSVILDTAMGQTAFCFSRDGKGSPTVNLSVTRLLGAKAGDDLIVRTKAVSAGKRLLFISALCWSGNTDSRPAYTAEGVFYSLRS